MTHPAASPQPQRTVRVIVVDDDKNVREALADLIADEPGLNLVGTAADADEAAALAAATRPDVAVVDFVLPGGGENITRDLVTRVPGIKVIGMSGATEVEARRAMLSAGAARFLPKGGALDLISEIWALIGPE
jgi:DNA-binding NarL/FixJ family response regulator